MSSLFMCFQPGEEFDFVTFLESYSDTSEVDLPIFDDFSQNHFPTNNDKAKVEDVGRSTTNSSKKLKSHQHNIGRKVLATPLTLQGEQFRNLIRLCLGEDPTLDNLKEYVTRISVSVTNGSFPLPPRNAKRNKNYFYNYYSRYQRTFLKNIHILRTLS